APTRAQSALWQRRAVDGGAQAAGARSGFRDEATHRSRWKRCQGPLYRFVLMPYAFAARALRRGEEVETKSGQVKLNLSRVSGRSQEGSHPNLRLCGTDPFLSVTFKVLSFLKQWPWRRKTEAPHRRRKPGQIAASVLAKASL